MKRENNKIVFHETGRFHINNLTETYFNDFFKPDREVEIKVLHLSSYQICNVYTDKETVLEAYIKLNGATSDFKVVMDKYKTRLNTAQSTKVIDGIRHNNKFNCHGYTFLDGIMWLELNNKKVNIILEDDGYKACDRKDLQNNGVALYFDEDDQIVHSGRMVEGRIMSKFGINALMTKGEVELFRKYRYVIKDKTKYYNPSSFFKSRLFRK